VLVDVSVEPFSYVTAPEDEVDTRPLVRLYGDSTVLASADGNGPVPAMTTYSLTDAGIDAVLAAAAEAGLLGRSPEYGPTLAADAPTTTVTLAADRRTSVHSVAGLGLETDEGLTPAQREARQRLQDFIAFVRGFAESRPDLLASEPGPYAPKAVDVFAWEASVSGDSGDSVLDWPIDPPLGDLLAGELEGLRCTTVTGADLATLQAALEGAREIRRWRSGDRLWDVGLRLLLPGDERCFDVAPATVAGEGYHGVLMTPEQWAGYPAPGGRLALTDRSDVARAEDGLRKTLEASSDPREREVAKRLGEYARQYLGVERDRDGARLVYVNAFCDDAGRDPKAQVVSVDDGGTCFWQALVDANGTVLELRINGEA